MKKYIYILPLLALSFSACRNYFDEKMLDNANPEITDIRTGMTYTFTDDDYAAVSSNATNKAKALALCTPEDSTVYKELQAIKSSKAFTEAASADLFAPAVLADKFPYLDNGTLCDVNYTQHEGKTSYILPFQTATGYTLTNKDYEAIWHKRGVYYLTESVMDSLPAFLKNKLATATEGKIVILNYEFRSEEPDSSEMHEILPYAVRLSKFMELPDDEVHEITGKVARIMSKLSGDGKFYMEDGEASLYVYGVTSEDGTDPKIFKTLKIAVGDSITIRGKYQAATESSVEQLVNGVYVNHWQASAAPRRVAAASTIQTENRDIIFQLGAEDWAEYTNELVNGTIVLPQASYDEMGETAISAPETTIARFLSLRYPYAKADDAYIVAYRGKSGTTGDLFVFDGTQFVMNTGYVSETMSFEKKQGNWIANISTFFTAKLVGEGLGKFTLQHITLDGLSYVWRYQASYGATASAYVSSTNHRVEDWLVSPVIRLKKSVKPQLTFDQAVRYGAVENNPKWLNVLITNNYTGDVTTTEWKVLEYPTALPDGSSWTFQSSGAFDLSEYNGEKIVIAFRYNTNIDGIEVSSAPTWEIQNVLVAEPAE